jgi:hypothetical protein
MAEVAAGEATAGVLGVRVETRWMHGAIVIATAEGEQ